MFSSVTEVNSKERHRKNSWRIWQRVIIKGTILPKLINFTSVLPLITTLYGYVLFHKLLLLLSVSEAIQRRHEDEVAEGSVHKK